MLTRAFRQPVSVHSLTSYYVPGPVRTQDTEVKNAESLPPAAHRS